MEMERKISEVGAGLEFKLYRKSEIGTEYVTLEETSRSIDG